MPVELTVKDFTFEGPLGCHGATIEQLGHNHFRVVPGPAPEHPEWSNKVQFTNDAKNWHPVHWDKGWGEMR